jgi:chromosome segregation ATPase
LQAGGGAFAHHARASQPVAAATPRTTPDDRLEKPMSKLMISLMAAAGIAFAGAAGANDRADHNGMSRDQYKAEKDRIESQYKADKDACKSQNGNAKDVCEKEAKGKEKVAKADLEARYKNTDKARYDARVAKADADYDVAKEKCDDLKGNQKDVCVKEAKAAHTRAKADAKVARVEHEQNGNTAKVADARRDAREDTRDAQYKVAKEKCDALKGDAKDKCVADAKLRYNQ